MHSLLYETSFSVTLIITNNVQEVLRDYERLSLAYQEKCNDHENEAQSRRNWQSQCTSLTRILQAGESNAFILALIDGDGAIFQDMLLQAGAEGGSDAAHKLYAKIKNHVQEIHENTNTSQWSVMVCIYANLEGLARKLASCGIIHAPADMHAFARSFSLNQPLFSFIDVGVGKERADHKLKGEFLARQDTRRITSHSPNLLANTIA